MAAPETTVVIPTHNRATLVSRAIESVLDQTYTDFELVVVDDASTDDTEAVVDEFADERISYLRHGENRHASAARNTGLERARGDFVAFLDDDDEWHPSKLEKQVSHLRRQDEQVGMVYCWQEYVAGDDVVREFTPTLRGDIFRETLDRQPIGNSSTLLVRRQVAETLGGFDEQLPRGNDGDFIRRVARRKAIDVVPEVLVRIHVEHDHDRITRDDDSGIRNAIEGKRNKLVQFESDLQRYPRKHANICANLAEKYTEVGEWRSATYFYAKALRIDPLAPAAYLNLFNLAYRTVRKPFSQANVIDRFNSGSGD